MDVEIVERIYRAVAARDLHGLAELLHPEIVITQDPRLPWGGRFVGHDGYGEFAGKLVGTIDSAVDVGAIFAADGAVYQYGHTRGTVRASGVAFAIPEVHRWVIAGDRAIEAHFAIDTPGMLAVLGLADA
jgi:uncharacterized protein